MTDNTWPADIAADRLAEYLLDVLDFVGRVDQAVTTGDLFYLLDKATALGRAVERLRSLAEELVDEGTNVHPYLPNIEAALIRAGGRGYRVAAKLHPDAVTSR